MTGAGITLWFGPGYVLHVSTEDGWQFERAEHRTWRVGFLFAVRGSVAAVPPYMTPNEMRAERGLPPLSDAEVTAAGRELHVMAFASDPSAADGMKAICRDCVNKGDRIRNSSKGARRPPAQRLRIGDLLSLD